MGLDKIIREQRMIMMNSDALHIEYLNREHLDICHYAASVLPCININSIFMGNEITLDQLIEYSLNEMSVFDRDIYLRLSNLLSDVKVHLNGENNYDFTTIVSFQIANNGSVIKDTGNVSEYIVPAKLSELSIYLFGHEHIHALKDTNYEEYKSNMIFGEVLSIFYELMNYNPRDILSRELIKIRMNSLMEVKREYLDYDFYAKSSSEYDFMFESKCGIVSDETKIYEFIRSKLGCYLIGFYYAIILYNLYKLDPKKILDLVSKVLKHEMTTLQLLEVLGIYGNVQGEVFEKELGNIRKLIK